MNHFFREQRTSGKGFTQINIAKQNKVKVRKFQNEFMNSSFLPKYKQKIVRISALSTEVRFARFLSGRFTAMVVINPPERKLTKRASVLFSEGRNLDNFLFLFWEK